MVGGGGTDTFQFFFDVDSGDDEITDFVALDDVLQLTGVFDYNGGGVDFTDLDTQQAIDDGWSVSDDGTNVTVNFGDNDGTGGNSGGLGSVVILNIGVAPGAAGIDSFTELNAAIDLQVLA